MSTEPQPPKLVAPLEHLRAGKICDEPSALFSLGNVVVTSAALTLIQEHGASVLRLLNHRRNQACHINAQEHPNQREKPLPVTCSIEHGIAHATRRSASEPQP